VVGPATATPLHGTAAAQTWRPDVRAARAYAAERGGTVSFALRTRHRLYGYRSREVTSSASVVKAMLMVAYLNRVGVRERALRRADLDLIEPMIVRSSNRDGSRVRDIVGNGALARLARRVGMRDFATAETWGATQTTAADQTRFFLTIERYVVRRHRDTALRLLGSIVPRQRWGIASVRPTGWALYFKGGWTPERQNQVGLLRRGSRRLALAVFTSGYPNPLYGRETQRGVAARLLRGLDAASDPG
jgi:hypothetical protein